jgi:hypothetical protein
MNSKTDQLIKLMDVHKLTAAQVGALLGRTAGTVRIWRCKSDNRTIPATALELLAFKLNTKKNAR